MRHFTSITQFGDLSKALEEAKYVKENPFADQELGRNKTLLMIFFNSSLRTRLSTQKAALNLGMNVIVVIYYVFHVTVNQSTNSLIHLSYAATGSSAAVIGLPTTM